MFNSLIKQLQEDPLVLERCTEKPTYKLMVINRILCAIKWLRFTKGIDPNYPLECWDQYLADNPWLHKRILLKQDDFNLNLGIFTSLLSLSRPGWKKLLLATHQPNISRIIHKLNIDSRKIRVSLDKHKSL